MRKERVGRSVVLAMVALVAIALGVPASAAAEGDATPPVLVTVSSPAATVSPGGHVAVSIDATDDVSLASIAVGWVGTDVGDAHTTTLTVPVGTATPITVTTAVDASWGEGTYHLDVVRLYDTAGNRAVYYADGGWYTTPSRGSSSPHDVEMAPRDFAVVGGADLTPPVLESFTMPTRADRAGAPITLAWKVSDARSAVSRISVSWTALDTDSGTGHVLAVNPAATGSAQVSLPWAGRWQVFLVEVEDAAGNSARYQHDGNISWSGFGYQFRHDLDLAALDLTLAPDKPDADLRARPGRLTVRVMANGTFARAVSGFLVTAQPSGVVVEAPVAPRLASGVMTVDLTGLPNGVQQTVQVVAKSAWGDSRPTTLVGRPQLSSNVQAVPDLTGDGRPDVVAQKESGTSDDFTVYRYAGTGSGGLSSRVAFRTVQDDFGPCLHIGPFATLTRGYVHCQSDGLFAMARTFTIQLGTRGWAAMRFVDGGYSLNADRYPDVIAVDPSGTLRLYAQTSRGTLVAGTTIGRGWLSMISVISAGDLNGDRRNDIAAVDASGRLWLYPGNGKGGVTTRRQIGSGWQSMGALLPLRDFDRDGKADLGGITMGGELRLYRGTGTGTVRGGVVIGTGWQRYL